MHGVVILLDTTYRPKEMQYDVTFSCTFFIIAKFATDRQTVSAVQFIIQTLFDN